MHRTEDIPLSKLWPSTPNTPVPTWDVIGTSHSLYTAQKMVGYNQLNETKGNISHRGSLACANGANKYLESFHTETKKCQNHTN